MHQWALLFPPNYYPPALASEPLVDGTSVVCSVIGGFERLGIAKYLKNFMLGLRK